MSSSIWNATICQLALNVHSVGLSLFLLGQMTCCAKWMMLSLKLLVSKNRRCFGISLIGNLAWKLFQVHIQASQTKSKPEICTPRKKLSHISHQAINASRHSKSLNICSIYSRRVILADESCSSFLFCLFTKQTQEIGLPSGNRELLGELLI